MDAKAVETWVSGYVRAWNSNDPDGIRALFSEDAAYYYHPSKEPWRGREAILAGWLDNADQPGQTEFRHQVLAATGEPATTGEPPTDGLLGVVRGWTKYFDPPPREYANLWLVRLDPQGRCTEFTEWWMQA